MFDGVCLLVFVVVLCCVVNGTVRCLLFVVRCSLLLVGFVMLVVRWSVGVHLLIDACCVLLLFDIRWWSFVCVSFVVG